MIVDSVPRDASKIVANIVKEVGSHSSSVLQGISLEDVNDRLDQINKYSKPLGCNDCDSPPDIRKDLVRLATLFIDGTKVEDVVEDLLVAAREEGSLKDAGTL